jgi:ATP adenylyltransferase/5',5'''-P-1,P-4-tetraphosphate phosphorylase II
MDKNNNKFKDFLTKQNHTWKLSADNYRGLHHVEEKTFLFDGFRIKVQFNPERMRSSAAKVDKQSIEARKCFLCEENRPAEQNSLDLGKDFILLVNPFPIFKTHFTIPSIHHIPQLLLPNLEAMLDIARQMEGYTLFYNGPECGASAPDHLHFQAGETGFLTVESEFNALKQRVGSLLHQSDQLKIWAFDHYLRKMISIETGSIQQGINALENILIRFQEFQPEKVEPMVNLLCTFSEGKWILHLFPRKLHRPSQFFEQGENQLLISPASVDFGGVFITPRLEDFDKITAADIVDIFDQVSLNANTFQALKESIISSLNNLYPS